MVFAFQFWVKQYIGLFGKFRNTIFLPSLCWTLDCVESFVKNLFNCAWFFPFYFELANDSSELFIHWIDFSFFIRVEMFFCWIFIENHFELKLFFLDWLKFCFPRRKNCNIRFLKNRVSKLLRRKRVFQKNFFQYFVVFIQYWFIFVLN